MVEFIPWNCVPTVSVIVRRNVSIFSSVFVRVASVPVVHWAHGVA